MICTFEEHKKPNSISEILPKDALGLIINFLTDDDLFYIRGTNKIFYEAYRDQRVTEEYRFYHSRALYLASIGYIFKHLTYLNVQWNDTIRLQCVRPENFPKLKILHSPLLQQMPFNPNITTVITHLRQFQYLKPETFPNLLHADIHMGDVPDAEVLPFPHPNLCSLIFRFDLIMESESRNDLSPISREYFPKLKEMTIYEAYDPDYQMQQMLEVERLRKEGVCVTEVQNPACARCKVHSLEENYLAM